MPKILRYIPLLQEVFSIIISIDFFIFKCHNNLFFRSIFAVCDVYNNLPQHVVDLKTIKDFQRYLTQVAKMRCQQGVEAWASSFCRRSEWAMNNII